MSPPPAAVVKLVWQSLVHAVPDCVAVGLGGSSARGVADTHSDIELYCYYLGDPSSPTVARGIVNAAMQVDARFTRSRQPIWDRAPWGPHSFLEVEGVLFEIGHRQVQATRERLEAYLRKAQFLPSEGLHDLAFGHYPSALAACIAVGPVLYDPRSELRSLQDLAASFPPGLRNALLEYYMRDAQLLITRKLQKASVRYDVFQFDACAARVVRSLIIVAMTLAEQHFPGDKWNAEFLSLAERRLGGDLGLTASLLTIYSIGETSSQQLQERTQVLRLVAARLLEHPAFPSSVKARIFRGEW